MSTFSIHFTPNPDSIKFTFSSPRIIPVAMISASAPDEASGDRLVARLLQIDGVSNVFLTPDFATVTKHASVAWEQIMERLKDVMDEPEGTDLDSA